MRWSRFRCSALASETNRHYTGPPVIAQPHGSRQSDYCVTRSLWHPFDCSLGYRKNYFLPHTNCFLCSAYVPFHPPTPIFWGTDLLQHAELLFRTFWWHLVYRQIRCYGHGRAVWGKFADRSAINNKI